MRVTNKMLSNNFLTDIRRNLNQMQKQQSQLTSGKEIRRASDNPFKAARSMQLHSDVECNKQYNENIKDTINWLDATDTSLDQITNSLQRVRELMVSAGNAAYGSDERRAIKDELNQKIDEVGQILNTNFDGKYLFGGTKGTSKPLGCKEIDGNKMLYFSAKDGTEIEDTTTNHKELAQLNMMGAKVNVEVSQGVTIDYNVTVQEILNFKDDKGNNVDVRKLLNTVVNNLDSNSEEAKDSLIGENLEDISKTLSNILKIRAEVGAKQNRMESAKEKNEEENFNMTEILSKTEDIDITEKMMEYSVMQTVYMASLQTSAKVIQPSLIDYLR